MRTNRLTDFQILEDLFHRLRAIIVSEGIRHVDEMKLDGKHPRSFFTEVTQQRTAHTAPHPFLYDDFFYISNDLVHFTAWLFYLRPHINDATAEGSTYHQNWFDSKYLSYASVLNASVYKFWDRIGDLLSSYFTTGLAPDRVYIGRVLNNFPLKERKSVHYERLDEIFNQRVKPVLQERDDDAHNLSLPSRIFFDIIIASGSKQADQVKQKLRMPEMYKEQIVLAYEGLESALRLITDKGAEKGGEN